jgi:hypothetical protein
LITFCPWSNVCCGSQLFLFMERVGGQHI